MRSEIHFFRNERREELQPRPPVISPTLSHICLMPFTWAAGHSQDGDPCGGAQPCTFLRENSLSELEPAGGCALVKRPSQIHFGITNT
jgi:hypothetical protein